LAVVFIIVTFCIIVFILVVITVVIFVVVVVVASLADTYDLPVVMTCTSAGRLAPELASLVVLNDVFATILPVRMAMMQA
jgi:hypothetical protein